MRKIIHLHLSIKTTSGWQEYPVAVEVGNEVAIKDPDGDKIRIKILSIQEEKTREELANEIGVDLELVDERFPQKADH